ncbi:dUTP diphosphatase [Patescibacteria group bacterium]|nr:dUTP diphosphatase [Patescibacteria group bacterium]MBU4512857.1 dUTP diphosphatase [Patescibacteria group bacterium]MCG2693632.1 dUTP diphosphatase [Candidatus Parcubacteria bacterium]
MQIKIKKLKPEAVIPSYVHPGDVGLDLHSLEDYELQPGERHIFYLGFILEYPEGYAAIIKDKGSLPKNGGVHTMGGVYDVGYRGEYNVILINLSDKPYKILKHDKIAQLIIFPVAIAELQEVSELSKTSRGIGRFGSTGR